MTINRRVGCVVGVLLLFSTVPSADATVTVIPSEDTVITQHPNLGGPDTTHGSDLLLWCIRGGGGYETFPALKFDLSSFAGGTVVGPATLELFVVGNSNFPQYTRTVEIFKVYIPWDAATVTYNNFGADPGVQNSDIGSYSSYVSYQWIPYPVPGNRYISWTIPQWLVQSWIDNPGSNYGILARNTTTHNQRDLVFDSLEGPMVPKLTFTFDADSDGLTDEQEAGLGTDPFDADTDDDGLIDGDEVNVVGTDPLDPDSDDDAVLDGADACLDSDLGSTVVVAGDDSGVTNDLLDDGCTIADLVADLLAQEPSTAELVQFLIALRGEGIITGQELGSLLHTLNSP